MNILLLKNTHNTESTERNFVKSLQIDGYLKDGSDTLTPSIIIEHKNPTEYTEMYIPNFGDRYYFIKVVNISNNMWELVTTEPDVLYTYANEIKDQIAIIDKQENNANYLIDDGSYLSQVDTFPEISYFPNGFNDDGEFILITAGA